MSVGSRSLGGSAMEQLLAMGFGPEARVRSKLELCDGDVDQ
eukprot:COSAG04_NODE_28697_length_274_cov_0.582857_1_plen_40_part_10